MNNIKTIQVLSTNCIVCNSLFETTKEAVKQLGLLVEVEYVTDIAKIISFGMKSAPVLVVNEQVASFGKFLNIEDVKEILKNI